MKKITLATALLAAMAFTSAQASDTLEMLGVTYQVDTLFHNQIGPGTTQTSLWIHNSSTTFRFFYATLDLTNPYLNMECLVAADRLKSANTLEYMVSKHTKEGRRQFVGINGDFFDVSGNKTHRGVLTWGSPLGPTISDGNVFLTRHNNDGYLSFTADTDGEVYINPFEYRGTITAADSSQAVISAVNPVRVSLENNAITVYNSYYFGSSDALGGCEVSAKLAPGETFKATGTMRFIVTSEPNTEGDMDIPTNGYVFHAKGSAEAFLKKLTIGDELVMETACTVAGKVVDPAQVVSGWPQILGDGEVLDTEHLRGDASARHPRTGIGYSDGGKKVYFCVVDGRQYLSAGARTSELATMMRYAGATEGMNLDGGGSSILYTTMLGARNNPSIGQDRATGNAMFAVCTAPDDDVIAELRFQDYVLSTPRYGVYVPHFFGYNQYGMLIDTDVQGVKLSCPESFGRIKGDSLFFATGTGQDLLTATLGDVSVSMPMTIVGDELDNMSFAHHAIVTDGLRDYTVEVQSMMDGTAQPLAAEALTWESSDPEVVTVGATTGVLRGLKNGTAQVYGTVDGIADTLTVTVECPTARVMTADSLDAGTWNITMRAGKDGVATPSDNGGFNWDYTGATGRLPRILMEKRIQLWSLPDTLRLRLNTGNVPMKQVVFNLYAGEGKLTTATVAPDSIPAGQDMVIDLPTAQWTEADNMGSYPITLASIQIDLNSMTSGEAYHMAFNGLETVYRLMPETPAKVLGDIDGNGVVDIDDVNLIINMMVGRKPKTASADIDDNGVVDVDDLNIIINIIVKKYKP